MFGVLKLRTNQSSPNELKLIILRAESEIPMGVVQANQLTI